MKEQKTKWKAWRKKLSGCSGESLAETLIALLIACLGLLLLPGAILAAGRVNQKAEKAYVFMDAGKGETESVNTEEDAFSMVISDGNGGTVPIETNDKVDTYKKKSDVKYYYYRLKDADT